MPCPTTPNEALRAVRDCVIPALTLGTLGTEILGPEGAGATHGCCPTGLLRVEYLSVQRVEDGSTIDGGNCGGVWRVNIRVIVLRCWQTYKTVGGIATSVVDPAVTSAAGQQLTDEGWAVVKALQCCLSGRKQGASCCDGTNCGGSVHDLVPIPAEGGCAGYAIHLALDLASCDC